VLTNLIFISKEFDSVNQKQKHIFPNNCRAFQRSCNRFWWRNSDRLAGQGSLPMAGTAVYMTSYSRLEGPIDSAQGSDREKNGMTERNTNANGYFESKPQTELLILEINLDNR
jgi:hypothetical protein